MTPGIIFVLLGLFSTVAVSAIGQGFSLHRSRAMSKWQGKVDGALGVRLALQRRWLLQPVGFAQAGMS